MPKRRNKTKNEIVNDIKTVQETDRLRLLTKEKVYPFLLQLNDSIGFSKIFLQVSAVTVESAFSNISQEMKVSELLPKLKAVFKEETEENKKYMQFFELMQDETISTFGSLMTAMPRQIEAYFTQQVDKSPVMELDITKILG